MGSFAGFTVRLTMFTAMIGCATVCKIKRRQNGCRGDRIAILPGPIISSCKGWNNWSEVQVGRKLLAALRQQRIKPTSYVLVAFSFVE
jgi:hypothetical protein